MEEVERELATLLPQPDEDSEEEVSPYLVLDGLDFVTAASGCSVLHMLDYIASLREKVHSLLVTSSADSALLHHQAVPLETVHAAFTLSVAHEASLIMSVRELDTGGARDISGVLRITDNGRRLNKEPTCGSTEEKEFLYHVAPDGAVNLFEKGT